MTDLGLDLLGLIAVVVLVLANAFFVAAEYALVRVRRTRIAELAAQGNAGAAWVERALRDLDRSIATTQLGITMAGLALGWVAEPALSGLLEPVVRLVPVGLREEVSRGIAAAVVEVRAALIFHTCSVWIVDVSRKAGTSALGFAYR